MPSFPLPQISSDMVPVASPGGLLTVTASFNRPADVAAYTAGDLIANSTTAGSVAPVTFAGAVRAAGEAIRIERARLRKSTPSLTSASFRAWLFRTIPTVNVGDNAAFNNGSGVLQIADVAGLVGFFDFTMDVAGAVGAMGDSVPAKSSGMTLMPTTDTTIYALLQATAGYVPGNAETFTLTLEGARS